MNEGELYENLSQHTALATGNIPTYLRVYQGIVMKDLTSNPFALSHIINNTKWFAIMNSLQFPGKTELRVNV